MSLALETSASACITPQGLLSGDPRGSCSPLPSSHSAHPLSPVLESGTWNLLTEKDLSQSILNLGQFAVQESAYERFNALAYYALLGHYSFSWLSSIVWTLIRYVTLRFRERRAQLRSPPQESRRPYLCVKSSPIRYDFLGGTKRIRYSVP